MGLTAGEVGFPDYLEVNHVRLLADPAAVNADYNTAWEAPDSDLITELNLLLSRTTGMPGRVFQDLSAYDPSTALTALETEIDNLETLVDALDYKADWASIVTKAMSKIEDMVRESVETRELRTFREVNLEAAQDAADLLNSGPVDTLVKASMTRMETNLARAYSRMAGGFADINGVVSTVFPAAFAILEADHAANLQILEATLQQRALEQAVLQTGFTEVQREEQVRNLARERVLALLQSIELMAGQQRFQLSSHAAHAAQYDNFTRLTIASGADQQRLNAEYDVRDAFLEFDTIIKAMGSLGAASGFPVVPDKLTPFQSVVGALGTAASFGLTAASALGPGAGLAAFGAAGILGTLASLDSFN